MNQKKHGLAALAAFVSGCVLATLQASAEPLPIVRETDPDLPGYNIYRPADMAAIGRPLPVITWANGGCVRMDTPWTRILERWASEGFFVIAIATPANASADNPGRHTVDDQAAAIDWAARENAASDSPYARRLDLDRVAAAGNSCGGITSLTLASRDVRINSVYVLSGSSVGPNPQRAAAEAIMSRITAPVVFVVGGPEDVARDAADVDYSLLPEGVPAMVVRRSSGDHRTVSTDPGMQAVAADVGATWFRATLLNDAAAVATLQSSICAQCEAATWSATSKNLGARR